MFDPWLLLAPGAALGMVTYSLCSVVYQGRQLKVLRGSDRSLMLEHHRSSISWALGYMLIFVSILLVEMQSGLPRTTSRLIYVHEPFAVAFAALMLAMIVYYNGERFPRAHRYIAYAMLLCFAVAFVFGVVIAVDLMLH